MKPRKWYSLSLTSQIMLGLLLGGFLGWLNPELGIKSYFLRDIFLNLIKVIIAPLIFSTIVVGIAGGGDLRNVGRMGLKALIYFEAVTTAALFIGLAVVNWMKPGVGVSLRIDSSAVPGFAQDQSKSLSEILVHIFPSSVIDSMARGDVLQIVTFSVLFAMAVSALGPKAAPLLNLCQSLSQVMFKFTSYVMRFAPFGVGAAMAAAIGHKGPGLLLNFGLLIFSLYLALTIFVIGVLLPIAWLSRLPVRKFAKAVWDPFAIAFATTSSESALPKAMEVMERFGVPKRIVGFVMPTGYSFNLDGTTLYLAMASVFVAQAAESSTGVHFGLQKQLIMMLTLMITSKGVAAVPRASLIILLSTLHTFSLPIEGVAVLLGIDEIMDMARTSVNVVGNCLATAVVARWEGEFDDARASVFGTPLEPGAELAAGETAFSESASRGIESGQAPARSRVQPEKSSSQSNFHE
ncbi:MAG: cation:dicarboxylase symporter family transporter [Terriglobia bacterium]